ncbi:MAG: hypothetical protein ABEJ69_02845 [Candidatus Nanohaloarchaea archaeon]
MGREEDLNRFYSLMARLKREQNGFRRLESSDGYMDWPERGVYFFFTPEMRVTRVGTHAVSEDSGTKLWERLRTHRGTFSGDRAGGGNHRASVFRLRVGEAIIEKEGLQNEYPNWGEGSSAAPDVRDQEQPLEKKVSEFIRELPFLWMKVDDEPGPESDRAYLERNAIALLSNYDRDPLDPRKDWLGEHSPKEEIQDSGLWNVEHVDEDYDPGFLDFLEERIDG